MNAQLTSILAKQHLDDLHRSTERHQHLDHTGRSNQASGPLVRLSRVGAHLRLRFRQASTAALTSPNAPRAETGHDRC